MKLENIDKRNGEESTCVNRSFVDGRYGNSRGSTNWIRKQLLLVICDVYTYADACIRLRRSLARFNAYRRLRNCARPWWNFHLLKHCPDRQARRVIVFALLC